MSGGLHACNPMSTCRDPARSRQRSHLEVLAVPATPWRGGGVSRAPNASAATKTAAPGRPIPVRGHGPGGSSNRLRIFYRPSAAVRWAVAPPTGLVRSEEVRPAWLRPEPRGPPRLRLESARKWGGCDLLQRPRLAAIQALLASADRSARCQRGWWSSVLKFARGDDLRHRPATCRDSAAPCSGTLAACRTRRS